MLRTCLLASALLLLLVLSASAEECVVLTTNLVSKCEEVSRGLWSDDLVPLKVGMDGTTCPVVAAGVDRIFGPHPTRPACCDAARAFAVNGCVCDPTVVEMTEGLNQMPKGVAGRTEQFMRGIMSLTQASDCAHAEYGGPILDPCSGGVGPCGGPANADPAAATTEVAPSI